MRQVNCKCVDLYCVNKSTHLELTRPHRVVLLYVWVYLFIYVGFWRGRLIIVDLFSKTKSTCMGRLHLNASQCPHCRDGWGPSRLGRVDLGQVDAPSVNSTSGPGHCYTIACSFSACVILPWNSTTHLLPAHPRFAMHFCIRTSAELLHKN